MLPNETIALILVPKIMLQQYYVVFLAIFVKVLKLPWSEILLNSDIIILFCHEQMLSFPPLSVLPDAGKFPCFREILGPKGRKFPCLGKFWALFLRVSIRVYISIYVRLILPVSTIYITGTFFVK